MSRLTRLVRRWRAYAPAPTLKPWSERPRLSETAARPEWESWFADKLLTSDWTTHNFQTWATALEQFPNDRPTRILEIGSYEGRSTIFFLRFLPASTIVCVDPFEDPTARRAGTPQSQRQRFDANVAEFGNRVTVMPTTSVSALARLTEDDAEFDLVYIDGSHDRDPVLIDSLLSWPLVRRGGLVIWDDYEWRRELPSESRPQHAIDWFLASHKDAEALHFAYQVIARKA